MKISYDPDVDIMVVRLGNIKAEGIGAQRLPFGDGIAHLSATGTILELEILDASKRYPIETLRAMAVTREPLTVERVASILGVTPRAVRAAVERGRLVGQKSGRDWVFTMDDVNAYLNSRWSRQGPAVKAV